MVKKALKDDVDWKKYWAEKKGKAPKSKSEKKVMLIAFGVIFIIIILMAVIGSFSSDSNSADQNKNISSNESTSRTQVQKQNEPRVDNSELKADIKKAYDVAGIEVTNKEKKDWAECEIELNGGYKRIIRNPLSPNEPLNNPYGLFTKEDGTRFDYATTEVTNVAINCKVDGHTRYGYYTF